MCFIAIDGLKRLATRTHLSTTIRLRISQVSCCHGRQQSTESTENTKLLTNLTATSTHTHTLAHTRSHRYKIYQHSCIAGICTYVFLHKFTVLNFFIFLR